MSPDRSVELPTNLEISEVVDEDLATYSPAMARQFWLDYCEFKLNPASIEKAEAIRKRIIGIPSEQSENPRILDPFETKAGQIF